MRRVTVVAGPRAFVGALGNAYEVLLKDGSPYFRVFFDEPVIVPPLAIGIRTWSFDASQLRGDA